MLGNCRCPVQGFFVTWSITSIVVLIKCLCDPGPLQVDVCGEDCGNIPVYGLHANKMFCLALPIESRNVKSL